MYEVADGTRILNLGEKRFVAVTAEGHRRGIVAQVCDVTKPLLSVRRVVEKGGTVVFAKGGGYIEDAQGERIWMEEKQGMYVVKVWVKRDGAPF